MILSGPKMNAHLALARISNSPTVVSNTLAGAALAVGSGVDVSLLFVAVAMVAFYTAGMYLNDIMDYEIDSRERADRPLVTGVVSRAEAWAVTLGLFVLGGVFLLVVGVGSFLAGIVLVGTIVLYDVWHKQNPLSPVIMGANRFMVYVVAFLAFASSLNVEVLIAAGLLWVYTIGLTFVAKSEAGDSFTNYLPLVTLFAPALYFGALLLDDPVWLVLVVAFCAWVVYSVSFIYRKKQIGAGIVRLIAGMSLIDALALASTGWTLGVVLALLAFGLTLFFQQYVRGT